MFCVAKLPFLLSLLFYLLSGNDNLREERRTKREKWSVCILLKNHRIFVRINIIENFYQAIHQFNTHTL